MNSTQTEVISTIQAIGVLWLLGGLVLPGLSWTMFQKVSQHKLWLVLGTIALAADVFLISAFTLFWAQMDLPSTDWDIMAVYFITPFLPNLVGIVTAFLLRKQKKAVKGATITMVLK